MNLNIVHWTEKVAQRPLFSYIYFLYIQPLTQIGYVTWKLEHMKAVIWH